MVYLDYAANTPTDKRVLKVFCDDTNKFFANPNSRHFLGESAKERMEMASDDILSVFKAEEIVFTSGASEANNLAIKGLAESYRENGRHIISTCLEHSSVSGSLTALQSAGYEIDLVDIDNNGQVDMEHLKELLRPDTILVSICSVDGELGIVQPVEKIGELLKEYPNCFFHTDATQAVGKVNIDYENADLVTFAPHKFYGLNGSGVLLKKKDIVLNPLINGGISNSVYRSGTPVLANATAAAAALRFAVDEMNERLETVKRLNKYLTERLKKYPGIVFNTRENTLPHFINVSVEGIKAADMQQRLSERGICVSTKSACSVPNTPSRAVYAITHSRKTALSSWRISLSHLTTFAELDEFLLAMEDIAGNGTI